MTSDKVRIEAFMNDVRLTTRYGRKGSTEEKPLISCTAHYEHP